MDATERNARIDELFDRALDRAPEDRAAFLDRVCGDDRDLLAAVQNLLDLVPDGEALLKSDALTELWAGAIKAVDSTVPHDTFGPYRVLREIGRGGMGAVFLAERADGEFEQQVAIKIVPNWSSSDERLRRFERERRLLAKLSHPKIARLLDGGRSADGCPYLVMEYVEGLPLDGYCDEYRPSLESRLELFLAVAEAVQYAHRNLVVHRDLKPSNVVVDGDGEVKLLDFGIALPLAEGEKSLTRGVVPMTPAYASPEQFLGADITTASDVYQLGLILYELLTGTPAQSLTEASPADWMKKVCTENPRRPSQAAAEHTQASRWWRRVRGDLDAIVLRALHKEPERRYGSVAELGADLERFRQGLPVSARPDAFSYRVRRFVRRHRVGVATAALVGFLLVVQAITATIQQRRIEAEAVKARQALAFLTSSFQDFTSGSSFTNRRAAAGPVPAREVIDRIAARGSEELEDQPLLQAEILTRVGELYLQLGHYPQSVDALEKALIIRDRELVPGDSRLSDTSGLLGVALAFSGRLREAERPLRRSYDIAVEAHGARSPQACWALRHLGDLLHSRGALLAAEKLLVPALTSCPSPSLRRVLASVLRDRGLLAAAVSHYREAITEGPQEATGLVWLELARALTAAGDLEAAEEALATASAAFEEEFGVDHPIEAVRLRAAFRLALARGEIDEAARLIRRAVANMDHWLPEDHHLLPRGTVDLAAVALASGRPEEALDAARAAASRYREMGMSNHPKAIEASQILAASLLATDAPSAAVEQLKDMVARQEEVYADSDVRLAVSYALLAEALEQTGGVEDAGRYRQLAERVAGEMPAALALSCRIFGPLWREVAADGTPPACRQGAGITRRVTESTP